MARVRQKPKKYANVAIAPSVHQEMRSYVAANPQIKGIGNLVAHLWRIHAPKPE